MNRLLSFTILLGSVITSRSAVINNTNVNETYIEMVNDEVNKTAMQIEALQKEKNDLYNKINKAIDEAIPDLERVNDTDAQTGLEHLKNLKKQIKEIHENDSYEVIQSSGENSTNSSDAEFRRQFSINIERKKKKQQDWMAAIKKDEFYNKLIKSRNKRYTSLPRVLNRQKIAHQIQDWLVKKAEERRKRKQYKALIKVDYEKCPDYGKGRDQKRDKKDKIKKKNIFPCCRKCCKKSYLGCL